MTANCDANKHGHRRGRRGAAFVEFALVLLPLVGMILFVLDMGRMLFFQQFFAERARAAVRAAVVNNWPDNSIQNYACYNSTSGSGPGLLGLLPSQVSVARLGTAGASDYRLQVKIQGVPMFTWIPWIAGQYTAAPVTATMPAQSLGSTN